MVLLDRWAMGAGMAALLVLAGSCTGYVERGRVLYSEQRFIEAAEVFERTESRLRSSTDEQRASYGLYRGMTMLRLGDLARSQRWLSFAYDLDRAKPGLLPPDERVLLDGAWDDLSRQLQTAVQPTHPRAAIADRSVAGTEPNNRPAPPPLDESTPTEMGSGRAAPKRAIP